MLSIFVRVILEAFDAAEKEAKRRGVVVNDAVRLAAAALGVVAERLAAAEDEDAAVNSAAGIASEAVELLAAHKEPEKCADALAEYLARQFGVDPGDAKARILRALGECEVPACALYTAAGAGRVECRLHNPKLLGSILRALKEDWDPAGTAFIVATGDRLFVIAFLGAYAAVYGIDVECQGARVPVIARHDPWGYATSCSRDATGIEFDAKTGIVRCGGNVVADVHSGLEQRYLTDLDKTLRVLANVEASPYRGSVVVYLNNLAVLARSYPRLLIDVATGRVCGVDERGPGQCIAAIDSRLSDRYAPDYAEVESVHVRAAIPGLVRNKRVYAELEIVTKTRRREAPVAKLSYIADGLNVVSVFVASLAKPSERGEEGGAEAERQEEGGPITAESSETGPTLFDACVARLAPVVGEEDARRKCKDMITLGLVRNLGDVMSFAALAERWWGGAIPREEKPGEAGPSPEEAAEEKEARPAGEEEEEVEACPLLGTVKRAMAEPLLTDKAEIVGDWREAREVAATLCTSNVCEGAGPEITVVEYNGRRVPVPEVMRIFACKGALCPWRGTSVACIKQRDGNIVCYDLDTRKDAWLLLTAYWLAHGIHPYTGGRARPAWSPVGWLECYTDENGRNTVCAEKPLIEWMRACTRPAQALTTADRKQ